MWKDGNALDLSKEGENGLVTTEAAAPSLMCVFVFLFCFFLIFLVVCRVWICFVLLLFSFSSCQKRRLWELSSLTLRGDKMDVLGQKTSNPVLYPAWPPATDRQVCS